MKNIKISFKKAFWAFLCLALICVNSYCFSFFGIFSKEKQAYATSQSHWEATSLIENSNFSPNAGAYPKGLSGWTSCDLESEDITKGVISVDSVTFASNRTKYYDLPEDLTSLSAVSGANDNNILMINNTSDVVKTYYYTSSNITLEENAFYAVSVWAKNYDDGTSLIKFNYNNTSLDFLSGKTNWTEFEFIVATNQIEKLNSTLELGIKNSTGITFFDFARCYKINENDFNSLTETETRKKLDLRNASIDVSSRIVNNNFESSNGWTLTSGNGSLSKISEITDGRSFNNVASNTHALKLASNDVATKISFESDAFKVNQFETLKLSFWAKSTCSALAKLTVDDFTLNGDVIELTKPTATTKTISTEAGSSANNGWKQYSMIIKGHAWCDANVVLTLSIGEGEAVEGELLIDGITLEQINYAQVNALEEDAVFAIKTFNETAVKNGYFNLASEISYDEFNNIVFPISPANWSATSTQNFSSENYITGIVNTSKSDFGANALAKTPTQLLSSFNFNNLLLIKNKTLSDFGMKSESVNLAKSSYHKIELLIYTNGGAVADVFVGTEQIVYAQKTGISTSGWQTISFFIKTSTFDIAPSITISHSNNIGCVFVDDVSFSSNISQADFENAPIASTFDLSKETFEITTNSFTGNLIDSTAANVAELISDSGIVNVNDIPAIASVGTPDGNDKVLMIKSADTVNYEFTSANNYRVSANGYFKVSLFCKVLNIAGTENANVDNVGAKIKLSAFSEQFAGIKNSSSDWTQYVFFINPSAEANFNLVLGLGNSDALTSGIALFDNIIFEELDEEKFETQLQLAKLQNANVIKLQNVEQAANEEKTLPEEEKFNTNFNWLWIPSLILAVSLIIAIAAVTFKNVKLKPRKKVKKESYDKYVIERKNKKLDRKKKLIKSISVEDENENSSSKIKEEKTNDVQENSLNSEVESENINQSDKEQNDSQKIEE